MELPEVWPYISWNIKDVSSLNSVFSGDVFVKGYRLYIVIEKKLYLNAKEDCLEMYLIDPELGSKDNFSFMMSTYLKDNRGENHFIQQTLIVFKNSESSRLIWRVTLLDLFENSKLDWKTNLHFVCMFGPESKYQKEFENGNSDSSHLCYYKDHLEKLTLEISRLLIWSSSADVILRCDDNKILADKNILSLRSPVFRKLFKNLIIQQGSPTEIIISGVDYSNLKSLLAFLYSGSVFFHHQTVGDAMQLYETAQRYKVSGLQEECRKFLVNKLTEDTAYMFLLFASEKKDGVFLNKVISFICKKDIMKSKGWKEFSNKHPKLALQTYFKYLDNYILTRSNLEYIHKLS